MKPAIRVWSVLVIVCSCGVTPGAAAADADLFAPSLSATSTVTASSPGALDPQESAAPAAWDPAPVCCTCYCWDVWANGLFLNRSSAGNVPLVFGNPGDPKGSEVFGTDDLDFGAGWGPQVGVFRCLNACNSVGVEFFAIDSWSSTGQVAGNFSVQFPSLPYLPELLIPGDPASGFGVATFGYNSRLYNTEVNLRHRSGSAGWLTTLAGFRWIELSEQFDTVFATGGTTPSFSIDTNNHLYGLQVGALANLHNAGPWFVDGSIKAGVFGNSASQTTREDFTSAGGTTTLATARGSNCAFAGDLTIALGRQLTDRLAARIGYMALWIEGVALAPEQLDNSDPSNNIATLDHTGGLFLHGAFAGLEYLW